MLVFKRHGADTEKKISFGTVYIDTERHNESEGKQTL